jgi:MFS family permease
MKLKRNIYLLYAIVFLQGMVFYAPIATLYRQAAGLNLAQIALIESISYLISLGMELPWGIIADRIGYKKTMWVCSALYFLSKLIFWQASSFGAFLMERVVISITIAGLSGVDSSILYLSAPEGKSETVFSRYNALGTVGLLLSAWFYSAFIGENYRFAALCTVVTYGLAALCSLGLVEVHDTDAKQRQTVRGFFSLLGQTMKDRRFLFFLLGDGLCCETVQMVTVWLNQDQYLRCGWNERAMGLAYSAMSLVSLCVVFTPFFTRKLGRRKFTISVFLLSAGACALLAVTRSPWLSFVAIAGISALSALLGPVFAQLSNERVATQDRATQLSIYAVIGDLVASGSNLVFGKVANVSLSGAFWLGAGCCIFAMVSFVVCYRKKEV